MTSPPDYPRHGASPPETAQAIWTAMRRRRTPWTAGEIAETVGASPRYIRRIVRALADASVIEIASEGTGAGEGRFESTAWRLARDLGPLAPRLLRPAHESEPVGLADRNGAMTAAEFRRIRRDLGLSLRQMAEIIGYRDPRAVRRFEAAPTASTARRIPAAVADAVRALRRC